MNEARKHSADLFLEILFAKTDALTLKTLRGALWSIAMP